jgi:hypothetical protein
VARPRKPRPAELVRPLERFAADYERKLSRLDAERDKLKAQRNNQMRSAARHGLPEQEIARYLRPQPAVRESVTTTQGVGMLSALVGAPLAAILGGPCYADSTQILVSGPPLRGNRASRPD